MCRSVETPSVLRVHATLAQGPSEALRKGVTIPPNFRVVAAFVFSIRLNSHLFAYGSLTCCISPCARTTTAFGLFQSTMSRHARKRASSRFGRNGEIFRPSPPLVGKLYVLRAPTDHWCTLPRGQPVRFRWQRRHDISSGAVRAYFPPY